MDKLWIVYIEYKMKKLYYDIANIIVIIIHLVLYITLSIMNSLGKH